MPIEKVHASVLAQQLHNVQVKSNLKHIDDLAQQNTATEFIHVLKQWPYPSNAIAVTNTLFWTLFGIATSIVIVLIFFPYYSWLWLFPIILFIAAIYKKENNKSRNQLLNQLSYWILEDKYNVRFNDQFAHYNISSLQDAFPLFSLGNYENGIEETLVGNLESCGKIYPYCIFRYHYVDESSSTDKDGNTTYSYHHADRWGIFIANMPIQGVSISSQQKRACRLQKAWTTSDLQFNKAYQLSGKDEMTLARFFNPSRVLILDKMLSRLKGDVYFHEHYPVMCWLFKKNAFEMQPDLPNIKTTSQLAEYLEQLHLPELEYLQQQLVPLLEKLD